MFFKCGRKAGRSAGRAGRGAVILGAEDGAGGDAAAPLRQGPSPAGAAPGAAAGGFPGGSRVPGCPGPSRRAAAPRLSRAVPGLGSCPEPPVSAVPGRFGMERGADGHAHLRPACRPLSSAVIGSCSDLFSRPFGCLRLLALSRLFSLPSWQKCFKFLFPASL